MYSDSTGLHPSSTREYGDGTKYNGEDPGLVFPIIPTVGGSDDLIRADERSSTYTSAGDASVLGEETGLRKNLKL